MGKSWTEISEEVKSAQRQKIAAVTSEMIEESAEEFIEARADEDDLEELLDGLFVNHIVPDIEMFMDMQECDDSEGYELFKQWFEEDATKEVMKLEA